MPVLVTSRAGGVSAPPFGGLNLGDHVGDAAASVEENRRRLAARVGMPVRYMRQVHGRHVVVAREPGPVPEADAMVTDVAGLALAVMVADCAPVLFEGPTAVGVAHAGRVGMAEGVIAATLAALKELGATPEELAVTVGPCVCAGCYEVPAPLRAEVERRVPGSAATSREGTAAIDLRAGIVGQLTTAGVANIIVSPRCPAENAELYSYRRDGRTGRFAGVAWLGPATP
ncbi:Laccase domain protein in ftsZ 3'region [Frankia canadensis]|uniref:Purine nucleoside phosphorylase n=1 Tax=Frankia canadensis TaxID=1836972 RepID=A0A2I2KJ21_9ACTN|nr:peptidoglycan editing factor PgeF [Frankia canadensis]SNQ45654.1 Laccase domain protein in ftsZ 3'region [Frankia canadensis]SOU52944.1 Laccase domain protein in ftsZ 3'region [Frankia canadensis]